MADRSKSSASETRKAKRRLRSTEKQQSTQTMKKKLREDEGSNSNGDILNSLDTNETSHEINQKLNGRGKEVIAAEKKTETLEIETIPTKEENTSSISKRKRRIRTKDRAATKSGGSKDGAKDSSDVKTDGDAAADDDAKKTVIINHKEQTNGEEAPGVDDSAVPEKSVPASNRKHGRLSLKRKEETDGPNVVEMLLKVKLEQGLKVKSEPRAAESSTKNGKCNDVSTPPVAPSLVNLGNTCFLSSVLQVFFYTPSFLENLAILSHEINSTEKDLTSVGDFDSTLQIVCHTSRSWKLVRNLNELLQKMKRMEQLIAGHQCQLPSPISPSDLLDTIQSMNSLFVSGQQQDSHELLRCVLSFIQEAIQQLNCCRAGLRALQKNDHPPVNGHGTNAACDNQKICETDDANMQNGFGKRGKGGAGRETRDRVSTTEAKKSGKQQRKRLKMEIDAGSNINIDPERITAKNANAKPCKSPQGFSKSDTSGANGCLRASLSPQTSVKSAITSLKVSPSPQTSLKSQASLKSETPSCKGGLKAAASHSSLTKSGIMSYFGAALKPRSLDDIVLRTERISDFVESLYQGRMEQRTRCLECEQVTRSVEDFQDVSLPVKKVTKSRVRHSSSSESEDCTKDEDSDYSWILKVVDEVERLDSENKFWCEGCVHHVEAERYIRYTGPPDVLTIQLKRFAAFSGFFSGFTKTMDCVGIPLHLPCLEQTCRLPTDKGDQHRYDLYAILSHSGISLSSGHYITYIRAPPSSGHDLSCPCDVTSCQNSSCCKHSDRTKERRECLVWYECDDEVVTSLSQCQLVTMLASDSATTPYMLFYEKRHM